MTYRDLKPKLQLVYRDLDDESKQAALEFDTEGVLRFIGSLPVQFACRELSLNDLWVEALRNHWHATDMMRFYRGMGYSLCGFLEIFSDERIARLGRE